MRFGLDTTFATLVSLALIFILLVYVYPLRAMATEEVRGEDQDDGAATFAPKLTAEDRRVDWSLPAAETSRRIRAMSPKPAVTVNAITSTHLACMVQSSLHLANIDCLICEIMFLIIIRGLLPHKLNIQVS